MSNDRNDHIVKKNPRHVRALADLRQALSGVEAALELLEGHPDHDLLDEVHADLRYVVLKMQARAPVEDDR